MDRIARALAALACALALAAPSGAAAAAATSFALHGMADEVGRFVAGVVSTNDHAGRPFAVVDKKHARIHVFDAAGRWRGTSPVLLGQTPGDGSAPDVGENTQHGYVPVAERTTPAGRFPAEPGRNLTGEHVVWVDYDAASPFIGCDRGARTRFASRDSLRVRRMAGGFRSAAWSCR